MQISGKVNLSDGDVADLRAGNLYLNLHTTFNPSGAARGQIILPRRPFFRPLVRPRRPGTPQEVRPMPPPHHRSGPRLHGVTPRGLRPMAMTTYRVRPGDSLFSICARTRPPAMAMADCTSALASLNQLGTPAALSVGQVLALPPGSMSRGVMRARQVYAGREHMPGQPPGYRPAR
jgi:hypothetical protein